KAALKALPTTEYDGGEWKEAKLHPDCYLAVEGDYYSAPHIHRHKTLRIKLKEHFPPNSDAYYEATPQRLLSQSRFIHADLNTLFIELFNDDVFAHIRRAMGLVSACTKEIKLIGHELASVRIGAAIATMRRYNRIRVPYFK